MPAMEVDPVEPPALVPPEQGPEIMSEDELLNEIKPRPYQEVMRDICIKQNTIIYLPTGAGKTYIAILVMQHFANQLEKKLSEGGKRTVFLVNTVALARQQYEVLRKRMPYDVTLYVGDMNVDNWKRDKWREEFEKYQIIVATTQIIVDVINHGYLRVSDMNLLIFDECHNGSGDHPMHQLMSKFRHSEKETHPRVIGLTGILIKNSTQPDTVEKELTSLEAVYHGTIATVENWQEFNNVMQFSTDPVELVLLFDALLPTPKMNWITTKVKAMIEVASKFETVKFKTLKAKNLRSDLPTKAKAIEKLLNDFIYQMNDFGIYGASIAILAVIVELELAKRSTEALIERKMIGAMLADADMIRHILVELMEGETTEYGKCMVFGSHKLQCLINRLEKYGESYKEKNVELKCLIFVQRRHSAKVLYHIIKRVFLELNEENPDKNSEPLIRPDFMVGRNKELPESIEAILSEKNSRKVLKKFKKNETNVICASSVLEEGIDIQSCNTVIRYDKAETFSSYIQTKGRARMKDSEYVIMISNDEKAKYLNKVAAFRNVEKKLKECLVGRTINRKPPLEEEIADELYNELIPPFITKSGAILTALSSLQILNRYAQTMPRDRFTSASVYWERVDIVDGSGKFKVQVKLYLPAQSTIKEPIVSAPATSVKFGKRAAAFEACKLLYENGELGETLLPIDSKKKMIDLKETYFKHWETFEMDNAKFAGTRQHRRPHDLVFPQELTNCTPAVGETNFLYVIKVKPIFPKQLEENGLDTRRAYHEMLSTENCLAILTTKRIPKLAAMQFFISLGEIQVELAKDPVKVSVNEEMLNKLKHFHIMIFKDILNTKKDFFVFDHNGGPNSYLIAPVKGKEIDWSLVGQFQSMIKPHEPNIAVRRKMVHKAENYLHKVIKPWYKLDENIYVVTKVHTDLTPMSPFPEDQFESYALYFQEKYQIEISQPKQFMLEVKGISRSLKILKPGDGQYGANTKALKYTKPEMYPPEFCHNFGFPGDLWLKATILPCTLYRIQQQLIAHSIWTNLNNHLNLKPDNDAYATIQNDRLNGMNKKPKMDVDLDDDDEAVSNSLEPVTPITFPNPDTAPVKEVDEAFQLLCEKFSAPWLDAPEPIDIDRNWDKLYPIELDYYISFISEQFEDLALSAYVEQSSRLGDLLLNTSASPQKRLAITDVPVQEKFNLNLLSMKSAKAPLLRDVVKAFTASGSNDVFDMERFEVLGDSLLKFAVSLYLIYRHQDWHEGYLTNCKGSIVSNRNLYYLGALFKFPGMIRHFEFDPRDDWVPPLFTVPPKLRDMMTEFNCGTSLLYKKLHLTDKEFYSGKVEPMTEIDFAQQAQKNKNTDTGDKAMKHLVNQQYIGDKIVADCMEAVLGVYLHSVGIEKSLKLLSYLKILPDDGILPNILSMILASSALRADISSEDVDGLLLNFKSLEKNLGYHFNDRKYLLQALTHPSSPTNHTTGCYQQLEFIGDAILDYLVSNYIFQRCPEKDPGELTDLRSALTNNNTLACVSVRNGFHMHLLAQNTVLQETIDKFVEYQKVHEHRVTDQVYLLITENDQTIGDTVDVPKVLGDIFESLIGAIFFDSGSSLQTTWEVIYRLLHNEILEFTACVPKNIIRRLEEWPNAMPRYSSPVVHEDGFVKINLNFTCKSERLKVHGFGKNTKDAKWAAAKVALQQLECAKAAA